MSAAKDFATFKAAALSWRKRFGLFDWEMSFVHEPMPVTSKDALSTIYLDGDARHAKLVYRHRGNRTLSVAEIAKHEMLHLLPNDFATMVARRASDMHDDAIREEHRLIERLMVNL